MEFRPPLFFYRNADDDSRYRWRAIAAAATLCEAKAWIDANDKNAAMYLVDNPPGTIDLITRSVRSPDGEWIDGAAIPWYRQLPMDCRPAGLPIAQSFADAYGGFYTRPARKS